MKKQYKNVNMIPVSTPIMSLINYMIETAQAPQELITQFNGIKEETLLNLAVKFGNLMIDENDIKDMVEQTIAGYNLLAWESHNFKINNSRAM